MSYLILSILSILSMSHRCLRLRRRSFKWAHLDHVSYMLQRFSCQSPSTPFAFLFHIVNHLLDQKKFQIMLKKILHREWLENWESSWIIWDCFPFKVEAITFSFPISVEFLSPISSPETLCQFPCSSRLPENWTTAARCWKDNRKRDSKHLGVHVSISGVP